MPQDLLPNIPHYPGLADDGVASSANVPPQFTNAYSDRLSVAPPAQQDYKQAAEIMSRYPMFTSSMLEYDNNMRTPDMVQQNPKDLHTLEQDNAQLINNPGNVGLEGRERAVGERMRGLGQDIAQPMSSDMPASTPETIDSQKMEQLSQASSLKENAALAGTGGSAYSDVRPSLNREKMEVETRADPLTIETPKLAPVAGVKSLPTEDIPTLAGGELGTGFVGTDQYGTSGDTSSGRVGQGFATVEGI